MPGNKFEKGKARRDKYFWLPVVIFVSVCICALSIIVTWRVTQVSAEIDDHAAWVRTAMRDRSDAIQIAEDKLLAGRISFAIYRDVVREALDGSDNNARIAAQRSLVSISSMPLKFADDIRKAMESMPSQVILITRDDASREDVERFRQALHHRANVRVLQEVRGADIKESSLTCEDAERAKQPENEPSPIVTVAPTCAQLGATITALLEEEGYQVKPSKLTDDKKYYARRFDILLAAKAEKASEKKAEAKPKDDAKTNVVERPRKKKRRRG